MVAEVFIAKNAQFLHFLILVYLCTIRDVFRLISAYLRFLLMMFTISLVAHDPPRLSNELINISVCWFPCFGSSKCHLVILSSSLRNWRWEIVKFISFMLSSRNSKAINRIIKIAFPTFSSKHSIFLTQNFIVHSLYLALSPCSNLRWTQFS